MHRADGGLANGLGNLVNRTLTLVHKYRAGNVSRAPDPGEAARLANACATLAGRVDRALDNFDFRAATDALWSVVDEGNRLVEAARPWHLAYAERTGDRSAATRLDTVLTSLVRACRVLADELQPFLPVGAQRLRDQLLSGDRVGRPQPAFPRLRQPTEA